MNHPATHSPLDRRRFLKAAGVCIALPIFHSLLPRASAAAVAAVAAAGAKKAAKRFVCVSNIFGLYEKSFFPKVAGKDYELSPTLQPMERHRNDFTVFSNIDHGIGGGHRAVPTLLSGIMPTLAQQFPEGNVSLDQKMAESLGAVTRYPSMTLGVHEANLISFTRTGVQVPTMDLGQMYRALFIDEDAANKADAQKRMARQGSILDLVLDQAKSVNKALGKRDQEKFEEYLASVRGLEQKIAQQKPWLDRPKPKTDKPAPSPSPSAEKDLKIMMELIALALQTDSTRVITLSSGFTNGDFGLQGGYHGFSHHGERPEAIAALSLIDTHRIAMIAHLIDLLKAQPDPINGGTLFDHTMILHGCGMATGIHSTRNLPLLLAGGGFKHGESKVYPEEVGKRVPAANLLLSILQNFGVEADRFGTSTGTLRGLERKA